MNYSSVRGSLKTGDLVLFEGKGFISRGIRLFTKSKFSHIGIVIKSTDVNMITIWESTTLSKLADMETGKRVKGVQLVLLSDRISTYNGKVFIKRLNKPITDRMSYKLKLVRKELVGKSYEKSKMALIGSLFDKWNKKEDLSSVFCSELVAECYQAMGLITQNTPSDAYTPADFDNMVRLLGEYSLGSTVRIKHVTK